MHPLPDGAHSSLRPSTTCCWYQKLKRLKSSKSVWSIGTTWLLSSTEKVPSLRPRHLCSLATSTLMYLHADSFTCLFSQRYHIIKVS